MSIPEQTWQNALRALSDARTVALACHLGPDGDALGSMLALAHALRGRGVECVVSWSEPYSVPKQYAFLPTDGFVSPPSSFPKKPDLMVTFDAGSMERLGSLAPSARDAGTLIVVDHHASNDHFGTINLVDADVAASAVIVYELLHRMDVALDRDIATCLYTGIVTDTGRFQYRNTTPAIHHLAAELLSHGVEHDLVTQEIYNTHSTGYLRLAGVALGRLEVREGLAWTYVAREDLEACGVGLDDIEALIDLVRTVDVTDVAAVLKQSTDGRYKVSMRSKGATDVGALCGAFGGGGHKLAAGFTAASSDPRAIADDIIAKLRA